MSSSVLERIRALHVEIESLEHNLINSLVPIIELHTANININCYNNIVQQVQQYKSTVQQLIDLYTTQNDTLQSEIQSISNKDTQWKSYYDSVSTIKQTYSNMSNMPSVEIKQIVTDTNDYNNYDTSDSADTILTTLNNTYTTDEYYGNYMDLQQYYTTFINLQIFKQKYRHLDYIEWLQQLTTILPTTIQHNTEYNTWLHSIIQYIYQYIERVYPLSNIQQIQQLIQEEFIATHTNNTTDKMTDNNDTEHKSVDTTELYCVACAKLFAKQTVYDAHLQGKKHIKNVAALNNTDSTTDGTHNKQLDTVEYNVYQLLQLIELLSQQYNNTIVYLTQKRIRSAKELQSDRDHLIQQVIQVLKHKLPNDTVDTDDHTNKPIYNPLQLPLGIDGEPIPYWLYKLHGLNQEYTCEICGNYTYYGAKAYENHFHEWRHIFGLKCLNIEPNKLYEHITKIDELLNLHKQVQQQEKQRNMAIDEIQEIEDSEGNVYNVKTYHELKRQGIL